MENKMSNQKSIAELEPKLVWQSFDAITKVPHPSKKEEKILEFFKKWATEHNFSYKQDAAGNLAISKPATPGMENKLPIAVQGHVDMVCEKNGDVVFDFDNDAIQTYIDGDFVKAQGTTLGADNGIGVAMGMATMLDPTIAHPPMELLLTVDEETGLTGATELATDLINAKILINLDSEEEDAFTIGCAGGINTAANFKFEGEKVPAETTAYTISVKGLLGGHSGINIHEGRGNAIVMLTRILTKLTRMINLRVSAINAPGKHNAIPREATAVVLVKNAAEEDFLNYLGMCVNNYHNEYKTKEPNLLIEWAKTEMPKRVMTIPFAKRLLQSLIIVPHGVYRMSPDIAGLVQTSTNLAIILTEEERVHILTSQRSSIESEKMFIAMKVATSFEIAGAEVETIGGYPAWEPNITSPIVKVGEVVYNNVFGKAPQIVAIHAGLECGLVGEKYPGMDMISFGPNLFDVHTPSEKVQISSVQKIWNFYVELLKNIPDNN